jgi:hypothetical protein
VDNRNLVTGNRFADGARFRYSQQAARGQHIIAFGLPIKLVDGEREVLLSPFIGLAAKRFAGRSQAFVDLGKTATLGAL